MICNSQVTNGIMKAQLDYNLCNKRSHSLYVCKSETWLTVQMGKDNMHVVMINVPQMGPGKATKRLLFNYNYSCWEGYCDT